MTEAEYTPKLDELDWLLNDPTAPQDAARIWSLLADLSQQTTAELFDPEGCGSVETSGSCPPRRSSCGLPTP
jgi:hypothetical protein